MEPQTIYEVISKLIGPIDPVGATHVDEKRYENLKVMTELVQRLIDDIYIIEGFKTNYQYSMKRAGEHASNFLRELGIQE